MRGFLVFLCLLSTTAFALPDGLVEELSLSATVRLPGKPSELDGRIIFAAPPKTRNPIALAVSRRLFVEYYTAAGELKHDELDSILYPDFSHILKFYSSVFIDDFGERKVAILQHLSVTVVYKGNRKLLGESVEMYELEDLSGQYEIISDGSRRKVWRDWKDITPYRKNPGCLAAFLPWFFR